ncbi:hypothetical protein K0M31_011932, partial [Melipona bicolor]
RGARQNEEKIRLELRFESDGGRQTKVPVYCEQPSPKSVCQPGEDPFPGNAFLATVRTKVPLGIEFFSSIKVTQLDRLERLRKLAPVWETFQYHPALPAAN